METEQGGDPGSGDGLVDRLERTVRQSRLVRIVLLLLFLVATGKAVYELVDTGHARVTRPSEGEREEKVLQSLHSDYTLDFFEQALGAPRIRRGSRDGKWVEHVFYREPGYWVQVITRPNNATVACFAVTSCSRSFRPRFSVPAFGTLTLYRSTLASVGRAWPDTRFRYDVWVNAPPSFFEYVIGPHALNLKNYAWGTMGSAQTPGCRLSRPAITRRPG